MLFNDKKKNFIYMFIYLFIYPPPRLRRDGVLKALLLLCNVVTLLLCHSYDLYDLYDLYFFMTIKGPDIGGPPWRPARAPPPPES